MSKSTKIIKTTLLTISIGWLAAFLYMGVSVFLEIPKQIARDEKFQKETVEPTVVYVKQYLKDHNCLPSDSLISGFNKVYTILLTDDNELTENLRKDNREIPKDGWILAISNANSTNDGFDYYISWQDKYIANNFGWKAGWAVLGISICYGAAPLIIIILVPLIWNIVKLKKSLKFQIH